MEIQHLGHATHIDLFKNFTNASDTIFEGRLIQIYNDGSSINLKFCNDLTQDRN